MERQGRSVFVYFMSAVLLFGAAGFGVYQYKDKQAWKTLVSNGYIRDFYEAAGYLDDVEHLLTKVTLTARPSQGAPIFAEIWRKASEAHVSIARLPYNSEMVSDSLRFLSQTSDFSYSMMSKCIDGEMPSGDDLAKLDTIRGFAKGMAAELNEMAVNINFFHGVEWDEIQRETASTAGMSESLLGSISNVTRQFQEYPALIYDGPFSDHIRNEEPKLTQSMPEITSAEGIGIVRDILINEPVFEILETGGSGGQAGSIPVWGYDVLLNSHSAPLIHVELTKKGGVPLWMLNSSPQANEGAYLTTNEALALAAGFLLRNSFENMQYSYYEVVDNVLTGNFAYSENGVIMYPDLVKVKVNMQSGVVIGLEALGYVAMHAPRSFPTPRLTLLEAKNLISSRYIIEDVKLAVIPLPSGREAQCYELRGKSENRSFLIYINTDNGKIEKIYELLISENGILAE